MINIQESNITNAIEVLNNEVSSLTSELEGVIENLGYAMKENEVEELQEAIQSVIHDLESVIKTIE